MVWGGKIMRSEIHRQALGGYLVRTSPTSEKAKLSHANTAFVTSDTRVVGKLILMVVALAQSTKLSFLRDHKTY